jgi:glycine cleavage system pyridoxal-binding protein P
MKYRFQGGGDISIPNLRQAYYPMAYGGPMVRYMAGKMNGPNIF